MFFIDIGYALICHENYKGIVQTNDLFTNFVKNHQRFLMKYFNERTVLIPRINTHREGCLIVCRKGLTTNTFTKDCFYIKKPTVATNGGQSVYFTKAEW